MSIEIQRYVDLYEYQTGQRIDPDIRSEVGRIMGYLHDAGISSQEIIRVIRELPRQHRPRLEDLPAWLWQNSLLEKNTIYWHRSLHIQAEPEVLLKDGSWNRPAWFREMKIRFTEQDLYEYAKVILYQPQVLWDERRDLGTLRHLMERCRVWTFCKPIDAVLAMIDLTAEEENAAKRNLFSIRDYETNAYFKLQALISAAVLSHSNQIVWRPLS